MPAPRRGPGLAFTLILAIVPTDRGWSDQCSAGSPPIAAFSVSCQPTGTCTFQSSSTAAAGIAQETWNFGDGATGQGAVALHAFGASGAFLVTLTVTDLAAQVASESKLVQLGAGEAPLAVDDLVTAFAGEDAPIEIAALLLNDAPGVIFRQIDSAPLHGTITFGGSAQYIYRSDPGFSGSDSLLYSVRSENGTIGSAIVMIDVAPPPLVAHSDRFQAERGKEVRITVPELLANDEPPNAVFVRAENPVGGTLVDNGVDTQGVRSFDFTPLGSTSLGSFDYLISRDGAEPFEVGIVLIDVVNAKPTVRFIVTCQNRDCSLHDYSFDDIAVVEYLVDWGDGTTYHVAAGSIPDLAHSYATAGWREVRLTLTDGEGAVGTGSQWIRPNTVPVALPDSAQTEREIPVVIPVLANDTDADLVHEHPELEDIFITSVTVDRPGTIVQVIERDPVTPQDHRRWVLRVTPPDSFLGQLNITYQVQDMHGGLTAPVAVTVQVVQWPSVTDALGEQFFLNVNSYVPVPVGSLLQNDYDEDGDALAIIAWDTSVLAGTWTGCDANPPICTFRPWPGSAGTTYLRYTVSDPVGHKDTATVRFYVGVSNAPPVANDDYFTTLRGTPRAFTVQDLTQNDVDPYADALTVNMNGGPRDFGSLACTNPLYRCTYTPMAGFVGTDRFAYTVSDMTNPAVNVHATVLTLPTVGAFDAREDIWRTGVSQQTVIPLGFLTSNDYTPGGGAITVTSIDKTGLTGTLTCDSWGCTHKPVQGWSGATRFKYTAANGQGAVDTAIVKIIVGGTNAAPVAAPDTRTTPKNVPLQVSVFELLANDYDPNNDPLGVSLTVWGLSKGSLSCGNPQYWCTYTPNAGATGVETIQYTISDGLATASSTLKVTIQ